MNLFDEPFNKKENILGKRIGEIVTHIKDSSSENIWGKLLCVEEAFSDNEIMFEGFERGTTYWDISIIPIYQDGKIKYYIENAMDITERVISRKRVEEQNKLIIEQNERFKAIIESMSDYLIVFDKDNDLILNKAVKEKFGLYEPERMKKFFDRSMVIYDKCGNVIPYDDIPSKRVKRGEILNGYEIIVVSGSPILDDKNDFLMGIVVIRNISVHVENQKVIRKSKKSYLLLKEEKKKCLQIL